MKEIDCPSAERRQGGVVVSAVVADGPRRWRRGQSVPRRDGTGGATGNAGAMAGGW